MHYKQNASARLLLLNIPKKEMVFLITTVIRANYSLYVSNHQQNNFLGQDKNKKIPNIAARDFDYIVYVEGLSNSTVTE
jgi:hypothetical protein